MSPCQGVWREQVWLYMSLYSVVSLRSRLYVVVTKLTIMQCLGNGNDAADWRAVDNVFCVLYVVLLKVVMSSLFGRGI